MEGENDVMSLKATELRLGLPGIQEIESTTNKNNKRALPQSSPPPSPSSDVDDDDGDCESKNNVSPPSKSRIVGWPPVRSYRRNNTIQMGEKYVKVSMDGAPYLRKIDLKMYRNYQELLCALEKMFKLTIGEYSEREGYKGSEFSPAYEDKDGDLMLVGDVPWEMFMSSCKRLRIMRGSEARGLGCGEWN